jgi:hypothetical protein
VITADQLFCHAVGDYVLQSDWMAVKKTKSWFVALVHAASYALPFLLLTRSPWALAVIISTHAIIDRLRLARYVVHAKEIVFGDRKLRAPCPPTGYGDDKPPFMAVWLFIIADNLMHVAINAAALKWIQ